MSDWLTGGLRSVLAIAALALAALGLANCASLGPRLVAPKVTVQGIAVGGIQGPDAMVTLSLRLENPNATQLMLQSLRFSLTINDIALSTGATVKAETIAASDSTMIQLETRTNIGAVLQVIALSAGGRVPSLQYSLDGEAIVQNGIRLPFSRRGDIPLPNSAAPPSSR